MTGNKRLKLAPNASWDTCHDPKHSMDTVMREALSKAIAKVTIAFVWSALHYCHDHTQVNLRSAKLTPLALYPSSSRLSTSQQIQVMINRTQSQYSSHLLMKYCGGSSFVSRVSSSLRSWRSMGPGFWSESREEMLSKNCAVSLAQMRSLAPLSLSRGSKQNDQDKMRDENTDGWRHDRRVYDHPRVTLTHHQPSSSPPSEWV